MAVMQSICYLEIEPKTKHVQIYLHLIKRKKNVKERLDEKKRFRDPDLLT